MAHRGYSPHGSPGDDVEPDHFFQVRVLEQKTLQVEFSQRATAGAMAIQRYMQEHLEVLYSLGALYTITSQPLNREAFRELTQGPLKRYPSMQGLGWVPRVSEAQREAYLAAAHKEGMVDFEITEWTPRLQVVRAARHEVYYPIFYIEPLESQRAALGFHLGSVPCIWKRCKRHSVQKRPWPQPGAHWHRTLRSNSFSAVLAGLQSGSPPPPPPAPPYRTFEERRANLQGFTMAIFRLSTLVDKSLQGIKWEIGLELSDVTDAVSRYLLLLQISDSRLSSWTFSLRQSAQAEAIRAGLHWETTFNVAGRKWSVLFHPIPEARNTYSWQAWSVLVGGVLFTLLCAGFLLHLL